MKGEHINDTGCRGCVYHNTGVRQYSEGACSYCATTGTCRLMPIENCTLWRAKGPNVRRRVPPPTTPEHKRRLSAVPHGSAISLWREGRNDREIAEELRFSITMIRNWRIRYGLEPNYRRHTGGLHG